MFLSYFLIYQTSLAYKLKTMLESILNRGVSRHFLKGFNIFFLNLPLKYVYLRYALPVKYALCVLRNIYPKKSVFKMLFTA